MKIKQIICIACCTLTLGGCDLMGSLDNLSQDYVLTDDNAVTDLNTAESALAGIYNSWKDFSFGSFRDLMFVRSQSLADVNQSSTSQFRTNVIESDNTQISGVYTRLYYIIANANSFISNVNKATMSDVTAQHKAEMLSEAYFNKALAETHLLRLFGEFYDLNSAYGIVLWDEPIRSNAAKARATVQESYNHILECLDKAGAVDAGKNYHANPLAVKALKARILLDMQNYSDAAKLAGEIMSGASLESDYLTSFRTPEETNEVLFTLKCQYPNGSLSGSSLTYYNKPGTLLTTLSQSLYKDGVDQRYTKVFDSTLQEGPNKNNKYMFAEGSVGETNTFFFIRLSEVCLIKAEAEARLKNYSNARTALKLVTDRAGYDEGYVDTIADGNLVEKILEHKYMELFMENYEEWFDMVRLYKLDGKALGGCSNIAAGKSLILPIPRTALSGNNLLVPNP